MYPVKYSLSCGSYGDGKSVCLWRTVGSIQTKIARFQCDEAARTFAKEFDFPLNSAVAKRFEEL